MERRLTKRNDGTIAHEIAGGDALRESPCEGCRNDAIQIEGKILKGAEAIRMVARSPPNLRAGVQSARAHLKAGVAMHISYRINAEPIRMVTGSPPKLRAGMHSARAHVKAGAALQVS